LRFPLKICTLGLSRSRQGSALPTIGTARTRCPLALRAASRLSQAWGSHSAFSTGFWSALAWSQWRSSWLGLPQSLGVRLTQPLWNLTF